MIFLLRIIISGDLHLSKKIRYFHLQYFWFTGEDVTAMIDGPELKKLGLVASASDCFVSPDSIPDEHSLKHYLLRDM